jgi:transcriptional regulator with XRE-family HTH domain
MKTLVNNLKHLRKINQLTQQQLADKLGVNRSVIGAYEEDRAEPKLGTLLHMCEFFKINIDDLLTKNLTGEVNIDLFKGKDLRLLSIVVDKETEEEVATLVPQKASAGYTNGYGDVDFIGNLPKFALPFPELSKQKTYRIFQISGDSMLPVVSGSYIICEYITNWNEVKNDDCYILLTKDDGIVYKRITNNIQHDGNLVLKSDNPSYESYSLPADHILEVWKALGFTSFDIPEPQASSQNSLDLLSAIQDLKSEIKGLK